MIITKRCNMAYATWCQASVIFIAVLVLACSSYPGVAADTSFQDFLQKDADAFRQWKATEQVDTTSAPARGHHSPADTRGTHQTVYLGQAEADQRAATLTLNFKDATVWGRLIAKGVTGPNIRLPTTDITFGPVKLTGRWEDDSTTIAGKWTGGDYMNGQLVTEYPTNGTLMISIADRSAGKMVYLHRIGTSASGYVFPPRGGVVHALPDLTAGDADAITDTVTGLPVVAGYWDPVGKWSGSMHWIFATDDSYATSYRMNILKDGSFACDVISDISCETTKESGIWRRRGKGLEFVWSGKDTMRAVFDGANCLNAKDEHGVIKLYRNVTIAGGGAAPGPEINLNQITGITLTPSTYTVCPGTNYPLPTILGKRRGTATLVELTELDPPPNWPTQTYLTPAPDKGRFAVSKHARPDQQLKLRVSVAVGKRIYSATCNVSVSETPAKGVFYGGVGLDYDPRPPAGTSYEKKPLSSQITLSGPNGSRRVATIRQGEKFRFENLPAGRYVAHVTSVRLPKLIKGYVSAGNDNQLSYYSFWLPSTSAADKEHPWNLGRGLYWPIRLEEDLSYCLYGTATYKGNPIKNMTVTVRSKSSERETTTDDNGHYRIGTDKLDGGSYYLSAIKWRRPGPPIWAQDGDLMDIASSQDGQTPLMVNLPAGITGLKIDIPCLTRKECMGSPGSAPTPTPEELMPDGMTR